MAVQKHSKFFEKPPHFEHFKYVSIGWYADAGSKAPVRMKNVKSRDYIANLTRFTGHKVEQTDWGTHDLLNVIKKLMILHKKAH